MSEVGVLISSLLQLQEKIQVENLDLLLEGLSDLDEMIEMKEVKASIVTQIKFLLINFINKNDKNFDGHMLHTVLSGPPGAGKTQVGNILAKIWSGLGILKSPVNKSLSLSKPENKSTVNKPENKSQDEANENEKQIKKLTSSGKVKSGTIKKLQAYVGELKTNLKEVEPLLTIANYRLRTLKREIERNRSPIYLIDEIIFSNDKIRERLEEFSTSKIPDENVIMPELSADIVALIELSKKLGEQIDSKTELEPKSFDLIRVVSREDFVAPYVGQTALKTEKLLQSCLGKVLFIDEAYSLVNDEKDSFGREALTVLNRFMSEYSDSIIIVFAGYKDLMNETIFNAQPGLKRRCSWYFEITGYSEEGLSQIFEKQLNENGWNLSKDVNMVKFFKENKKHFPNFGGSCLQLTFYCKLVYSTEVFDNDYPNDKIINEKILKDALKYLKTNSINSEDTFPTHLYC